MPPSPRRALAAPSAVLTLLLTVVGLVVATSVSAHALTWPAATDLSSTGQDALAAQIVVGPDGTATAVWTRSNGTNTIVQTATRPAGGAWQSPVDLSAAGQSAAEPRIVVAPDGGVTAAWRRSNGTNNIVQAATRAAGASWQSPVDVSVPGHDTDNLQLAVGPDGTATLAWTLNNGTNWIIQAASRPAGGSWQVPTDLSAVGQSAFFPKIAIGPGGANTAVWVRYNGVNWIIQAASRSAGGSWQSATNLSAAGQNASFEASVAIGSDGTATALWARSNGDNTIVQTSSRPASGAWQSATDLSAVGQNASSPRIAIGPEGTATAVWLRYDGTNNIIQSTVRAPGGAWQSPTNLSTPGHSASGGQISVAPDGTAIAIWGRSNGTNDIVQVATRPLVGAWQSPVDLSLAGRNSVSQQIAVGADGTLGAVWSRYNGGVNFIVQASVIDQAFPKPAPKPTPTPMPTPTVGTSAIKGPKVVVRPKVAKFTFTATVAGATFQCRLDKAKKWVACRSPYKLKTKHVKAGRHVLHVRAVLNGVADPTPSTKKFKVR